MFMASKQERFCQALKSRAADVTERYRKAGYFPTASVRVFDREKTLAAVQVGDAREDSVFDAASLTKIATTTQVLLLIDEGRLTLDTPVEDILDEIKSDAFLHARLKDVTIRRLLTHTSSIVDWYPFYCQRGDDFFTVLRSALLKNAPIRGMVYSDLNYMLLGKMLERIHHMPLAECLQKNLVQPLQLGMMTYKPSRSLDVIPSSYGNSVEMDMCRERGIQFNHFRPLDKPVQYETNDGNAHYYFNEVAGHAGIFASPEAYERLCRFYMTTDRPIFSEAQQEQPNAPTRGLGFQLGPMYPYGCGHTGFTGTCIWFSREKNLGAVAFTNRLFYLGYHNPNATADYRRALHETVLTTAELLR